MFIGFVAVAFTGRAGSSRGGRGLSLLFVLSLLLTLSSLPSA